MNYLGFGGPWVSDVLAIVQDLRPASPEVLEFKPYMYKCSDTSYIYITCSWQVFVFPILQSPHDVALIFPDLSASHYLGTFA